MLMTACKVGKKTVIGPNVTFTELNLQTKWQNKTYVPLRSKWHVFKPAVFIVQSLVGIKVREKYLVSFIYRLRGKYGSFSQMTATLTAHTHTYLKEDLKGPIIMFYLPSAQWVYMEQTFCYNTCNVISLLYIGVNSYLFSLLDGGQKEKLKSISEIITFCFIYKSLICRRSFLCALLLPKLTMDVIYCSTTA